MSNPKSCNVQCSVLLPIRTLEDFPTDLDDCEARSILAAWTVLWHPQLLAASEQSPVWHRADSPPEPHSDSPAAENSAAENSAAENSAAENSAAESGQNSFVGHLFISPNSAAQTLPDGYEDRAKAAGAVWITGDDRRSMLSQLNQAGLIQTELPAQVLGSRTIGMEDFFAAGYAALQVQVMTRRLRYTSNLDQVHLQTRLIDSAKAFLASQTGEAIEALHDVLDCLAEERDHYFTSDPHLIDLTLVTPSTIDAAISDPVLAAASAGEKSNDATSDDEGVLQTPANVLIDADAINLIAVRSDSASREFCEQLRENKIGWAAGGPSPDVQFDLMDYASSARAISEAHKKATDCIGAAPLVYGRISGETPSDLMTAIALQGYAGVIPLNFTAGTGHGSEAKVLFPVAGDEIEALTVKPIDAASDSEFLSIGARLGEAIDGGEIATGLLVHWPGQGCDSFRDLRRLASWSLSLGRFWKIGDYFTEGQQPYHQGALTAVGSDTPADVNSLFADDAVNPIIATSEAFKQSAADRQEHLLKTISSLLGTSNELVDSMSSIASSIGTNCDPDGKAKLVVNVNSIPMRIATEMFDNPAAMEHIYSCHHDKDHYVASVDVPAIGYAVVRPVGKNEKSASTSSGKSGVGGWLRNRFLGRSSLIAEGLRLHNEFMEVEISEKFGGIAGVYSGGARGNRFSLRLVAQGFAGSESAGGDTEMRCDDILVTKSTATMGQIEAKGRLFVGRTEIARFVNRYSLASGSRLLGVQVELTATGNQSWDSNRWGNYVAARVAVSEESSVCRAIIRDKLYRTRRRRVIAPLGFVIDEADRQTLVTSDGYPLHRIVGKRFYDTLLLVRGQSSGQFNLRFGFDIAQPVATAWSELASTKQVSVSISPDVAPSSWFAHVSPSEVLIGDMILHQQSDQSVALEIELIATRGKFCTASLRFFRNPSSAQQVSRSAKPASGQPLNIKADAVRIPLGGHEVCRIMVFFADQGQSK